jgi:hypothetical protein
MIDARELMAILESPEYQRDLEEVSSYAASIKQERPMVLLLAKYLHRQGYTFRLEHKHCDLVVDGTRVEFKFHYDFDITVKVQRELRNHSGDIKQVWMASQARKRKHGWTVIPGIYGDVCGKDCDIFVWVVCARDVTTLTDDRLTRVCFGSDQRKYNGRNPYGMSTQVVDAMAAFLKKLRLCRPFSLAAATITTKGDFPCTYYLRLCTFARPRRARR